MRESVNQYFPRAFFSLGPTGIDPIFGFSFGPRRSCWPRVVGSLLEAWLGSHHPVSSPNHFIQTRSSINLSVINGLESGRKTVEWTLNLPTLKYPSPRNLKLFYNRLHFNWSDTSLFPVVSETISLFNTTPNFLPTPFSASCRSGRSGRSGPRKPATRRYDAVEMHHVQRRELLSLCFRRGG